MTVGRGRCNGLRSRRERRSRSTRGRLRCKYGCRCCRGRARSGGLRRNLWSNWRRSRRRLRSAIPSAGHRCNRCRRRTQRSRLRLRHRGLCRTRLWCGLRLGSRGARRRRYGGFGGGRSRFRGRWRRGCGLEDAAAGGRCRLRRTRLGRLGGRRRIGSRRRRRTSESGRRWPILPVAAGRRILRIHRHSPAVMSARAPAPNASQASARTLASASLQISVPLPTTIAPVSR